MKIFIISSKAFYDRIGAIIKELRSLGHEVTPPLSFENPRAEIQAKAKGPKAHREWKSFMMKEQAKKVAANEAVLVVNMEKNGIPNYIGGSTFLEIYEAWRTGKRVILLNPLPDNILRDELHGMAPNILNGNLSLIGVQND